MAVAGCMHKATLVDPLQPSVTGPVTHFQDFLHLQSIDIQQVLILSPNSVQALDSVLQPVLTCHRVFWWRCLCGIGSMTPVSGNTYMPGWFEVALGQQCWLTNNNDGTQCHKCLSLARVLFHHLLVSVSELDSGVTLRCAAIYHGPGYCIGSFRIATRLVRLGPPSWGHPNGFCVASMLLQSSQHDAWSIVVDSRPRPVRCTKHTQCCPVS
jgi:hypothetical protein